MAGFTKLQRLKAGLATLDSAGVALSGGTDSSFLLWACRQVLPASNLIALTFKSPLVKEKHNLQAAHIAASLGVRHVALEFDELKWEEIAANQPSRCYRCKKARYTMLIEKLPVLGVSCLLDGTNHDDLEDYRPGLAAIAELGVLTPLAGVGLDKEETKELARIHGVPGWQTDPDSCMATRVAYGQPLNLADLSALNRLEEMVEQRGFNRVRARLAGRRVTLEVRPDQAVRAMELEALFNAAARREGFAGLSVDPGGYRSHRPGQEGG